MTATIDLTGQRFGRFVVTKLFRMGSKNVGTKWWVRCDCGATKTVLANSLRTGKSKSCGCYKRDKASETFRKHGDSLGAGNTPEYRTWVTMRSICRPNARKRKYFADKDIGVCTRWESFENFLADVGPRPGEKFRLERLDRSKGFEPDNVMWRAYNKGKTKKK